MHNKRSIAKGAAPSKEGVFWDVVRFDTLDSTNTRIKAAIAAGASEGTCLVARMQTGAYGRQGRGWSSPEGGSYFSFVLDPIGAHVEKGVQIAQLPSLSLALSVGVRAALSSFARSDAIKIKWPNDIVVIRDDMPLGSYAKICGISLESTAGKLCCGVGVNVFRPAVPAADSSNPSTATAYDLAYLEDIAACPLDASRRDEVLDGLLTCLLDSIQQTYEQWLEFGIESLIATYNALLFNNGQPVMLDTIDGKLLYEGEVLGVNEAGALLLKTPESKTIAVVSGEVHTRPPSVP